MISAAELEIQRKLTMAFVNADPETIVLTRREKVEDGAGGFTLQDSPPEQQTVRMVPQSDKVPVSSTLDGERKRPEFIIVAMPLADIRRYDTFDFRGTTYQVSHVHDCPEYEFKADVVTYVG